MAGKSTSIAALSLALLTGADPIRAMEPAHGHWVTSWYAAPQPAWNAQFILPMNVPATIGNQSLRETVRLSAGGHRVRLVFSNRYGSDAVAIGEVRIGTGRDAGSPRLLTFSGKTAASIAPGALLTSDPLVLDVAPLSELTVSSYLPSSTTISSFHWGAQQTVSMTHGNAAAAMRFPASATTIGARLFLNAVMVDGAEGGRTVVVLGDSITDGNGSTPDANRRWPDFLAERLAARGIGVANAGISGARLLKPGMGHSALARFEQDVLAQPGVSDVIILLGTNDIGWPGSPFAPQERAVTLDELTAGLRQLASAAHARNIRITTGTLPPFEGALEGTPYAGHYSRSKEALRLRLNHWIRTAGEFDAVVDFDAVLRDPARPQRLRAAFDSGDHLHPGDAGYRAMAAAIDIEVLAPRARPLGNGKQAAR